MRLFTAVLFSDELREALIRSQSEIRACSSVGNFTKPSNLHLTLRFIGETDNIGGAITAVSRVSASPFTLRLRGTGRFGDLYWAGADGGEALTALAESVETELRRAGFPPETRPFRPHVTLARQVQANTPVKFSVPDASMTVSRVSLMKSERIKGQLVYTEIYGKPLF